MLNLVGDAVNGSILECGLEKPAGRKHLPVFALFVIGQKGKRSQPKQMDVGSADKSVKRCKLLVKNSASHSSNGVSESPRYFCSLGMQRLFKFSFVPFFDETGAVSVEQQLQVSDVFSYLDAFVGICLLYTSPIWILCVLVYLYQVITKIIAF